MQAVFCRDCGEGPIGPRCHWCGWTWEPLPKHVFLTPWPTKRGTGVGNVVFGLSGAMRGQFEPAMVSTGWGPDGLRLLDLSRGLRNQIAYFARFIPAMAKLWRITRGAATVNPHFVGLELLPLLALRRLRLCPRVILSVHGSDITEAQGLTGWRRAAFRWMLTAADSVVACSRALAMATSWVSPAAKVTVSWNGLDLPESLPSERPIPEPYLICVAGFVKVKAHDVLLRAWESIRATRLCLRLVLIGNDGPELEAVRKSAGACVTVLVDLPHDEVLHWVKHAECFVLASRQEAFGIAALEAGALGVPVVATRVGGVPEFLTPDCGLLCEPDNADDLAMTILATLADRPAALRRATILQAKARGFTWHRAFEDYRQSSAASVKF